MVMRYAKQPFTVTTSKGQAYTIPAVSAYTHTACVAANSMLFEMARRDPGWSPAMRAPAGSADLP